MKMEQFILDMISEIGGVEKTIAIGTSLLHLICNFYHDYFTPAR